MSAALSPALAVLVQDIAENDRPTPEQAPSMAKALRLLLEAPDDAAGADPEEVAA